MILRFSGKYLNLLIFCYILAPLVISASFLIVSHGMQGKYSAHRL